MSEQEREDSARTGSEESAERAGGDTQTRVSEESGCAVESEESPDTDYRDSVGETLAGDPTKLGKP